MKIKNTAKLEFSMLLETSSPRVVKTERALFLGSSRSCFIILFNLRDKKCYTDCIWMMIKYCCGALVTHKNR